jgi:membrane protein implicated in regulation of membrane protease activity
MKSVEQTEAQSQAVFRKTLQKYIVLQIPGAVMVGLLLIVFYYVGYISVGMGALLFTGWLVKDAAMFRVLRSAYEPGPLHGTEALVGRSGIVVDDLAPKGLVRIGSEHWTAEAAETTSKLSRGARVRVVSVEGYTVTVAGEDGA